MPAPTRLFTGSPIATTDTVNGATGAALSALDCSNGVRAGAKVYNRGTDAVSADSYFTLKVSAAAVDHITVEAALGFSTHRWILDPAAGGTGTVTSVAPTPGGLLAVAGSPAVSPTIGIAAMPNQTVIGNGSGASAVPVTLVISAATGLIADATTLKNTLTQGVNGGQTIIGGGLTTENVTLRPNAADTTTGAVILLGGKLQVGALANPFATTPWILRSAATNSNMALVLVNPSTGTGGQVSFLLANADALNTGSGGMSLNSTGFTTSGNSTAGTIIVNVASGTGNMIHRITQAAGDHIWETGVGNTERLRLSNAGVLVLGAGMLVANGAVGTTVTALGPAGSHTTIQEWLNVKGSGGVDRWIAMY